jgi:hypothetical protein
MSLAVLQLRHAALEAAGLPPCNCPRCRFELALPSQIVQQQQQLMELAASGKQLFKDLYETQDERPLLRLAEEVAEGLAKLNQLLQSSRATVEPLHRTWAQVGDCGVRLQMVLM